MKDIQQKRYWIWLSLLRGLGSKRKQKLLKIYQNPQRIYNLSREELLEIPGIGAKLVENIINQETKRIIDKHIEYMNRNEIDIISIQDEEYPNNLKQIYDPPITLYIKGNKDILNNKSIGIVGCREVSDYGKKSAKYFSYNFLVSSIVS